jgi:hypothetical protein
MEYYVVYLTMLEVHDCVAYTSLSFETGPFRWFKVLLRDCHAVPWTHNERTVDRGFAHKQLCLFRAATACAGHLHGKSRAETTEGVHHV